MFDVIEIFEKCQEAGLTNVYVGFKKDFVTADLILIRLSCDHPSGKGRVSQQAVYDKYYWPLMINSVIGKLQRMTKEEYKCNAT